MIKPQEGAAGEQAVEEALARVEALGRQRRSVAHADAAASRRSVAAETDLALSDLVHHGVVQCRPYLFDRVVVRRGMHAIG